jgi:hypothetical protein
MTKDILKMDKGNVITDTSASGSPITNSITGERLRRKVFNSGHASSISAVYLSVANLE